MRRAASAEIVKRTEIIKTVIFAGDGVAQDSQPSGSSTMPSAGAVMKDVATNTGVGFVASSSTVPRQEVAAAMELFRGYDEQAETPPTC